MPVPGCGGGLSASDRGPARAGPRPCPLAPIRRMRGVRSLRVPHTILQGVRIEQVWQPRQLLPARPACPGPGVGAACAWPRRRTASAGLFVRATTAPNDHPVAAPPLAPPRRYRGHERAHTTRGPVGETNRPLPAMRGPGVATTAFTSNPSVESTPLSTTADLRRVSVGIWCGAISRQRYPNRILTRLNLGLELPAQSLGLGNLIRCHD